MDYTYWVLRMLVLFLSDAWWDVSYFESLIFVIISRGCLRWWMVWILRTLWLSCLHLVRRLLCSIKLGVSACYLITYIGSNAYIYLNALHMLFLFSSQPVPTRWNLRIGCWQQCETLSFISQHLKRKWEEISTC
jgi:hypothetical protein